MKKNIKVPISTHTKGLLALIFLGLVYASTGIVARYMDGYFSLFQQIYIRTFFAIILGFVVFRDMDFGKLKKISKREWLLLAARAAAMFVFGATLWVKATTLTKLANVAFIDAVPLTATLTFLLRKEEITARKTLLLLLSFIGVLILSIKDINSIFTFGFGEVLVFISGFFFAFRNISRRWHSKLLNDQEISQIMFVMGFVMLLVTSVFIGETITIPAFNLLLLIVIIAGGLMMIANLFLTNFGFAHVNAVLGNNILNLEAIFALLIGFSLYQEIPSVGELLGGTLILVSVIAMSRQDKSG